MNLQFRVQLRAMSLRQFRRFSLLSRSFSPWYSSRIGTIRIQILSRNFEISIRLKVSRETNAPFSDFRAPSTNSRRKSTRIYRRCNDESDCRRSSTTFKTSSIRRTTLGEWLNWAHNEHNKRLKLVRFLRISSTWIVQPLVINQALRAST